MKAPFTCKCGKLYSTDFAPTESWKCEECGHEWPSAVAIDLVCDAIEFYRNISVGYRALLKELGDE